MVTLKTRLKSLSFDPTPYLLTALVFAVYANSLRGAFVFDDLQFIQPLVGIQHWQDMFLLLNPWRPVLMLSYYLNYWVGGLNPVGYHLVNVGLHAINTVLVYHIIRHVQWNPYPARAGAAIFAVHALFTGAVSSIAGRSSLLCATFYFAAVLLYMRGNNTLILKWNPYSEGRPKKSVIITHFLGVLTLGYCAWLTKQEAIALPLFLGGLMMLRYRKWWMAGIGVAGVLPVVWMYWGAIKTTYATTGASSMLVNAGFDKVLPAVQYLPTYIVSIVWYYLPRMVLPYSLSADVYVMPVTAWYDFRLLSAVAVLAYMAARCVVVGDSSLGVGLLAILVSPLTVYAVMPLADVVLEHRAYIPGLGVALLAAYAVSSFRRSRQRTLLVVAAVVVLSVMTIERNKDWRDAVSLWKSAVDSAPNMTRPHFNLGQSYGEVGRYDLAIAEYDKALELNPKLWAAYNNKASLYINEAEYFYLQKQPQVSLHRFQMAEKMLLIAINGSPDFVESYINLAVLYMKIGRPADAIVHLQMVLVKRPEVDVAWFNMGEALSQMKEYKSALRYYSEAQRLRPDLLVYKGSVDRARRAIDTYGQ